MNGHHGSQPTRRAFLQRAWNGFAALPVGHLLAGGDGAGRGAQVRHHAPRAKSVIFLYMDGGPSGHDLFDFKPRLVADHGKPFPLPKEPTQFNDAGDTLGPCAKFAQRGASGQWISDLLPQLAGQADRLCVVRSMVADFSEHTNANYFLHTGHGLQGRPGMGAWIAYGLGCEADDLPAYVVLNGGLIPPGGIDCFHSSFLPAHSQGSVFQMRGDAVANIAPRERDPQRQRRKLQFGRALDEAARRRQGPEPAIDAAVANAELAFRMQAAVPELTSLRGESPALQAMYGCNDEYEPTRTFARQCLLARRLVERGVRFVQLTCADTRHDRWDQHGDLPRGLADNCRMVDRPIAALLADLDARGLLDETIVLWAGEMGRTPHTPAVSAGCGRDHHVDGYSIFLAGGGFRGGMAYGETDDFGNSVVADAVDIHDIHATILHQLGVDHERLTFRHGGRDHRLTDVHGRVIHALFA